MRRYLSIDILRATAILLMIQVHFVENLSPRDDSTAWLYDASLLLGSIPAPLFTFVSGLSYGLWLRKHQGDRHADAEATKISVRRGLFLFGTGIAFNFFAWLPEDTFNWDILTLIGTSLLFLAFARKLPASALVLICGFVLLISPILRVVGDYSSYWGDDFYTYDFTPRDVIFGFLSNGFFPVFPWIVFPVVGFLSVGPIFHRRRGTSPWRLPLVAVGLLLVTGLGAALAGFLPLPISRHYADGLKEFPATTGYVLLMLGLMLLGQLVLHRWVDTREGPARNWFVKSLTRFSAFSLTVYVVHHLVILWPLWVYGVWKGHDDPTYYWRQVMSAPLSLALSGAFIVVCHFGLVVMEKFKVPALESLMRWLCD